MNTTTTAAPKRPLGFWIIGLFALVWNLIGGKRPPTSPSLSF